MKIVFPALIAGFLVTAVFSSGDPAWALTGFIKSDSINPVLTPGTGIFTDPVLHRTIAWEAKDVFNPATVVRNGKLYLLYRAQDAVGHPAGTSRIGLAESIDGYHFTRRAMPVLYPDNDAFRKYEWEGGCEDPRVVEDGKGVYYMTYTGFDGHTARLLVATSTDLVHWTKHGPAFGKAMHGKYLDKWSKSGSIVSRYEGARVVAARIKGKYWMYWGDQFIWAAVSDNLIDWTPVEKAPGQTDPVELRGQAREMPALKIVLPTRKGKFDSDLVESGPPAMLTDQGILLLYNSRNIPSIGDPALPEGTYTASEALFDSADPTHLLHRLDHYFLRPDKPYELTGQVSSVCFIEGLARFDGRWMLYYGTADSKIAVATRP
ncbi:MAG TPA: glycoside hydrolase family 130 protein [Puia sp.]|jgi:predicted GH43/DUF377 family glycosyl hydrolase|nr:glycoside hydrolase family 130 protein [Puia sp.]